MTVSVIVATYEWPQAFDAVLRALADQSDTDFDLVVADDTGVCFIPRADILRVLELCEKKKKDEDARIEAITQGVPVPVFYGKG